MAFFKRKSAVGAPANGASAKHGLAGEPASAGDPRVLELGAELLEVARRHPDAKGVKDKLADWTMQDEAFKVQLFRFVDTFPMLSDADAVHRHLTEYLSRPPAPGMALPTAPPGMGLGLKAGGLMKGAMSKTIAAQITGMAQRYIAGTDASSAIPDLRQRWQDGIAFSVDLLGEACVSEHEAAEYRARYLDLITTLAQEVKGWSPNPLLESDHLGPIPRANVSIKVSSLVAKFEPLDFAGSVQRCFESLKPLLETAAEHNVLINFDVEQSSLKELNLALFMKCCEEIDFEAGLAMQAYLKSGDDDAQRLIDWAKRTGRQVTVRLVKGAYWDYEVIAAQEHGWPVPVWTTKADSDACFERMATKFVHEMPRTKDEGGVKLALGSHNLRSIAATLAELEKNDLPKSAVELQMLYGMGNGPKHAALAQGLRLREYIPIGEMIPGMCYLVRRLLENTSNESWLMKGLDKNVDAGALLASPHGQGSGNRDQGSDPQPAFVGGTADILPGVPGIAGGTGYRNEPMRDFSDTAQRETFGKTIAGANVPTVANDATVEQANDAVRSALAAFPAWRDRKPADRSTLMVKVADLMRQRRDELAGIMVKEAGKPWKEADADVCEAIDFCEYYARLAPALFTPAPQGRFLGEQNDVFYQPRGVSVVISPWNFPLAICTGMVAASLVTGNTVVCKPAEQTPGIAKVMAELFWQAGVPREALHVLAGQGETVGAALVRDPRVSVIAFTGSKAVGLDIIAAAGVTPDTQPHVKRVVCEMGGKNAIIIDGSADLDEAVVAAVYSAFGFAGQKCSACSRIICVGQVHDRFLSRFVEAARALQVDDPIRPGTDVGPVIDADAAKKIRQYIEIGKQEGKLELGLEPKVAQAWGKPLVGPHIFSGIKPEARLANEEIFGPVVAVIQAKDFDEALAIANATPYKLTGGLFSRTPSHIERARAEFRVGNLYLNRSCTGALVGRQPFGGFGMSGIGSKAGGDQYLYQFVEPRCVTENTMRRGFAPGLSG